MSEATLRLSPGLTLHPSEVKMHQRSGSTPSKPFASTRPRKECGTILHSTQHPQRSHHLLVIPFRLPTESVGTAGQCGLVLKLEECFSRSQEVIMTRTPDRSRVNGGSNRCRHLWPAWELMSTLTS